MADGVETKQHAIETILLEERRYSPPEDFASQANAQADIYDRDFEEFWETEARERVTWFEPFDKLLEWEPPYAKWYLGGKLNICFNCVDRHVEAGNGAKVAYYWEGEPEDERRELTFSDLQREVVRFANGLKKLGVRKGTPVAIYTSGTTAKPKGIAHTTGGYLVGVASTHYYIFDVKPESVYWCAADIGWVTSHSYIVYGPLCNGTTGVIYEGVPNYPDKDRWWAI